jgi:hypothetical protein
MELFAWWNLIFVLPFVAGLLYLALLAAGVIAEGHDTELHVDTDAAHDFGVEHSVEVGHGHDAAHAGHESGLFFKALSFLGLGTVPLSIIVMSLCFIWGFTGWASNQLFEPLLHMPSLFIWPSLAVAGLSTGFLTNRLARGLARIMPATETYATTKRELVGKRAETRFAITEQFGRAQLHDNFGNLLEVSCRVRPGEPPIPIGSRVVLMEYDAENQAFFVRPDPLAASGLIKQSTTPGKKEGLP